MKLDTKTCYLLKAVLFALCCMGWLVDAVAQSYQLITSVNELEANTTYLIASMADGKGVVMRTYESGNNHKTVDAISNNGVIEFTAGMVKLTLIKNGSQWYFKDEQNRYLTATSATNSNCLKAAGTYDSWSKFTIVFTSNSDAVITCKGKTSHNILMHNGTMDLFACYTDGQQPVYLYKYQKANSIVPYETKAEWGTIILPFEWTVPQGWTCYSCDDVDANGVLKLTAVDKVEKNVPYIINVEAGAIGKTHNFSGYVKETATANEHVGVLTGVLIENDKVPAGSYILSKYEGKMGFFQVAEDADYSATQYKCYVTLPKENAARYGALFFDDDMETGINSVSGNDTMRHGGVIYNMAGQRMNRLYRGLNIVDGKIILK